MIDKTLVLLILFVVVGCREQSVVPSSGALSHEAVKDTKRTAYATRHESVIRLHPSGLSFAVPHEWIDWHNEFGNNLHLTGEELCLVEHANGEWDTEYAKVTNAIFPFAMCAAHVGGEGWGSNAVSYGDLQVRVYDLSESADTIDITIGQKAGTAVTQPTNEPTKLGMSIVGGWRRVLLKYRRFYGDYGGIAHIDIRYRRYGERTIVFVFMYQNYERHAGVLSTMLESIAD